MSEDGFYGRSMVVYQNLTNNKGRNYHGSSYGVDCLGTRNFGG